MNGLIAAIGGVFILWAGKSILVPFLIAIFLWYLINAITAYYRKVMPYNKSITKKIPVASKFFDFLAAILSLATFGGLVYLFISQINPVFKEIITKAPDIQAKLHALINTLSVHFGFNINLDAVPNLPQMVGGLGAGIAGAAATAGMVIVYIMFMFVEQSTFQKKFAAMFRNKKESKKLGYILHSIDENMKKYLFMKTLISIGTAAIGYFWLSYLGVGFPIIWAFLIFITNYVPTFGAIISCAVPILYSLVTSDTMHTPILVAAGLIGLQIVSGNIIEPRLTGKTLNLSTLAILVNLVFWGVLWGVWGMFFSVPLLVAVFIVTAQFDSTRWFAILLSTDGEIPEKKE